VASADNGKTIPRSLSFAIFIVKVGNSGFSHNSHKGKNTETYGFQSVE